MIQSIVFTFLPQDAPDAAGEYAASVFVSPQLTPDNPGRPASDFPAFRDWPAVVAEARIAVERSDGTIFDTAADPDGLRSDLWETYLAPITVRGWGYRDLSATEIRSFPAQSIHALAQGLYRAVAQASGGAHPDPLAGGLRQLGSAYAQLGGEGREGRDKIVDARLAEREHQRRGSEAGNRPMEPGGMAPKAKPVTPEQALADPVGAALDLAEARRFYDRPEARDPDEATYPKPDPRYKPPELDPADPDFHDVLGSLADHPELLRALGIIVPVRLPASFVGAGGDFRVALDHPALAGNAVAQQPWTRTVASDVVFQPVSETGDIVDGVLMLDDVDRYDVTQVDIDSTAMLVEQRVANVYPIAQAATGGEPVTGDLPALRSTGFTVTRLRRAMILTDRIARSKSNADNIKTGKKVVLFAEDLVRGFRVDVHDGADWRSLMHRAVHYLDRTSGDEMFAVADQEAYLKASSLTSVPKAAVDRAYLHEAMFGWDGWSLVVPRPGKHIPKTPGDETLADDGEQFKGPLMLNVRHDLVPGTLPRLRYGKQYRFRVRPVDLAGMSTALLRDDPATAPATFRRFQPVSHPAVVPRHAFTEGESARRLVIRTGVDADNGDPGAPLTTIDPAAYAEALAAQAGPRTFALFRADCQRHLAPPKTSQQEAELLGCFDDAIGLQPNGGAFDAYRAAFARARREQGTLADTTILDANDPAADIPAEGIHLVPPLAQDGDFTRAELDAKLAALKRGEAPDAGFVVVHDTDALAVPYLPDPLAAGLALRFAGAGTARGWSHTEVVPYGGDWPDLATYRLVLVGGATAAVTVADTTITVTLPPGATAEVRASSTLADGDALHLLGMWDWIGITVPGPRVADVVAGGHQMITPGEQLVLVHATQRPLARPALLSGFKPDRALRETFTHFQGVLRSQSATTGRLDVDATWSEWFDDPASGKPPERVHGRTGHGFELVVDDGQDDVNLASGDAGDIKHEFGDHKHRKVDYAATATTRFREYLPSPVAADVSKLQVIGPVSTVHVPNSARPPVPVVHSVIPTFTWADEPDDPLDPLARARSRRGGLRVWLERPWYASGDDEMLGVVLSGADGIFAEGDLRRQYVSLWGKDPIRASGELASAVPRPRDFSGEGLLELDRLTLAELGSSHPGVTVLGHSVTYAPARDKWYADLLVDPGEAFWPFLRLGLTRLQPYSVADAHVSPVVLADFVQLTNQRTASVTRPDDATVRVTVTGIEERRRTAGQFASHLGFDPLGMMLLLPPVRGVRAWVERRGTTNSDLDWSRVGEIVDLARIDEDEVMRVWSGVIDLESPLPVRRAGTDPSGADSNWRLVVTEWESLRYDTPDDTGGPLERIVYLDRFPL
jgi:hypothetical protein